MQAAFIVLTRAKRDAEARLKRVQEEGRAGAYKLSGIQADIRDLEEAYKWLQWCHGQKLELVRLWNLVEERNRASVQIPSSKDRHNKRQSRSNRRRA